MRLYDVTRVKLACIDSAVITCRANQGKTDLKVLVCVLVVFRRNVAAFCVSCVVQHSWTLCCTSEERDEFCVVVVRHTSCPCFYLAGAMFNAVSMSSLVIKTLHWPQNGAWDSVVVKVLFY